MLCVASDLPCLPIQRPQLVLSSYPDIFHSHNDSVFLKLCCSFLHSYARLPDARRYQVEEGRSQMFECWVPGRRTRHGSASGRYTLHILHISSPGRIPLQVSASPNVCAPLLQPRNPPAQRERCATSIALSSMTFSNIAHRPRDFCHAAVYTDDRCASEREAWHNDMMPASSCRRTVVDNDGVFCTFDRRPGPIVRHILVPPSSLVPIYRGKAGSLSGMKA